MGRSNTVCWFTFSHVVVKFLVMWPRPTDKGGRINYFHDDKEMNDSRPKGKIGSRPGTQVRACSDPERLRGSDAHAHTHTRTYTPCEKTRNSALYNLTTIRKCKLFCSLNDLQWEAHLLTEGWRCLVVKQVDDVMRNDEGRRNPGVLTACENNYCYWQ